MAQFQHVFSVTPDPPEAPEAPEAPKAPDPLTYYNYHSYADIPLPPGSPLETGIWPNATRVPNYYVSSNGNIFHDPVPEIYRFKPPTDIPEANMLQEALSYTWKDFDGWVGWKVPRWTGDRMKSYNEQWEFIQNALVEWWKGPKNLAPRLVSVGPWRRGLWDFVEPKWEVEALLWGYDGTNWEEYEQWRFLMTGNAMAMRMDVGSRMRKRREGMEMEIESKGSEIREG
ncbi:hypothetical protein G7Y79_00021g049830 [Physcia stellaris]|nr:hypothetical protein G7Y79_00021g049830 [Physcia stellaris]